MQLDNGQGLGRLSRNIFGRTPNGVHGVYHRVEMGIACGYLAPL